MPRLSAPSHPRPTVFTETDDPEIEFRTPFRLNAHSEVKRNATVAVTQPPVHVVPAARRQPTAPTLGPFRPMFFRRLEDFS
ncbi:MAG: hypothetical protein R3E66_09915 [bacterium]